MVEALFDTNIVIDQLNAVPEARAEIAMHDSKAISIITWMEVMVGADEAVEERTRRFLKRFEVIPLDDEIAKRAVALRRYHRIKLPDAVIWATALNTKRLLVTRNTKDFPTGNPGIRVPYII
ncbi:MAG: type II toxin-antitoxin system VapC family toxin [Trueperaceae bacterium]|nr:type II toxin-antitoxin system VapC family toxin [Trueperaceae bacterium]